MTPAQLITHIATISQVIGWQAGVGGMETAGSIVSYLAQHPEQIDDFIAGKTSTMDWPAGWHTEGCLTWHAMNGKIVHPDDVRRALPEGAA